MSDTQTERTAPDKGSLPFDAAINLEALALQQGVTPVLNLSALLGDFWPEEEGTDEIGRTLRSWRDK